MRANRAAKHSLLIGAFVAITAIAMGVFVVREALQAQHGALVLALGALAGACVDPTPLRRLAASRSGDSSDLISRVVDTFRVSSQKLLAAIRDGAEAGDPTAFAGAAHTLKSSSAQVGAQGLSSLCQELEALGRSGSCEGARELATRISEELESVREELTAENFGALDG